MKENKAQPRFISQFIKLMVETTKTEDMFYPTFLMFGQTSYKGIRMKDKPNYDSSYYRGLYNLKSRD